MSVTDWVQTISVALVALTLLLGGWQLRELNRQSLALSAALRQASYEAIQNGHAGNLIAWVRDDPELLKWHLRDAGYPVSGDAENRKTVYMMQKLENHERIILSRDQGLLPPEFWSAWRVVMRVDAGRSEFQAIWPIARRYYAQSLVNELDEILREIGSAPATRTREPGQASSC